MTAPILIHYGDEEKFCIDLLRADAALIAAYPTAFVSADLINYQKGKNWVEVVAKGGNILDGRKISKPRMDFYTFGEDRKAAREIGQLTIEAFQRAVGRYSADGMTLCDSRVETGLVRVPDKQTDANRYVLSLRLTIAHTQGTT